MKQEVGKGLRWLLPCMLLLMAGVVCAEDFVAINTLGTDYMIRQTDGVEVWRTTDSVGGVSQLAVGPDGNVYAATSNNQDVRKWDGETGEYLENVVNNIGHRLYDICFGPDIDGDGIEDLYTFGGAGQGVDSFTSSSGYTVQGSWSATVTTGAWVGDFGPDVNSDGVKELYVLPDLLQNSSNVLRVIDGANPTTELYTFAIPQVVRPGCLVAGSDGRIYVTGRNNDVVASYLPDGTDAQVVAGNEGCNFPSQIAEGKPGQWYVSNRFEVADLPDGAGSVVLYDDNFASVNSIPLEGTVADDFYLCIATFEGGPGQGEAHSQVPIGSSVDSTSVSSVSWYSPEQDQDGVFVGDPDIVSVDGYDVYFSTTEPNSLTDVPVSVKQAEQSYTLLEIDYNTTYYWHVDTHVTWDSNDITGNWTDVIQGQEWQFTTAPAYLPPIMAFDNVITTLDLMPATLSANITGNSTAIASVAFDLLEDDVDWPTGSDATITEATIDNQYPTALLNTTMPGTYKVKLVITDSGDIPTTLETVAEVAVYADACAAQKANESSAWSQNYYDRDGDCDVDVADFAVLANEWLADSSLHAQEPYTGLVEYVPQAVFDARIEGEDYSDPNACSDAPITDTTGIRISSYDDASEGLSITHASTDAFVEYLVDVPVAAVGTPVDVYIGHALNSGSTTLSFGTAADPAAYGTTGDILATGNWGAFTSGMKVGQVTFTASGPQIVRTTYGSGFNLDWFSFDF